MPFTFTPYADPITNTSSLYHMLVNMNTTHVSGILGLVILIALVLVIFIRLDAHYNTRDAFTVSAFLGLIVAMLLFIIGILPFAYVMGAMGLTGLGVVLMILNKL